MVFLFASKITIGNTALFIRFIIQGSGCVKDLLHQWSNDPSLTEEDEEFKAVIITLALPLKAWVMISGFDNDQQYRSVSTVCFKERKKKVQGIEHI